MPKIKYITFIISFLLISFLFGCFVFAQTWQPPIGIPPGGNVDAPLNVGTGSQSKQGGLIIGANSSAVPDYGLIVRYGNVGIGIVSPQAKLDVDGQIRMRGGSPGADRVLVSDAAGLASWKSLSELPGGANLWTLSGSNLYPNNTGWNVGIGTTNPVARLHVFEDGGSGQGRIASFARGSTSDRVNLEIMPGGTTNSFWHANRWGHNWHWERQSSGEVRVRQMRLRSGGQLDLYNPTGAMDEIRVHLNPIGNSYFTGGGFGIGTTAPGRTLHVNSPDSWGARFTTPSGYIDFGPANAGGAHIYTDTPQFFFNKDLNLVGNPSRIVAHSSNILHLVTSGSDRLTILSNGNVGIGTAGPSERLHVEGTVQITGRTFLTRLESPGYLGATAGVHIVTTKNSGAGLLFRPVGQDSTGGQVLFRDGVSYFSGNVGIGTTNPGARLHVNGIIIAGTNGHLSLYDNANEVVIQSQDKSFNFWNSGLGRSLLYITSVGSVGIGTGDPGSYMLNVSGSVYATSYSCASDLRFKQDLQELNSVLDKIKNINAYSFKWNKEEFPERELPQGEQIGLLAQEVEKEFPQLVTTDQDGYKSMDYQKMAPVLLQAIKEQQARIEALELMMADK